MAEAAADAILERLQHLHPKAIDLSLDRIVRLLARLDHPERRLPPTVHVAGTNGKGSTLAMLDAMLVADGRRVHRYVSPHLVRFNERILLHGTPIDEAYLEDVLARAEAANVGEPITFFEITTVAAFLAFAETQADVLLLETGMGGRLDATNVVERPALTLVTPISMDHESYLGDTIKKIAAEKAGIVKQAVPLILGAQPPAALDVLLARANALRAPVKAHGRDWRVNADDGGLILLDGGTTLTLPRPTLEGIWQIENAGLAAMAARALNLTGGAIAAGLRTAAWPARLQRLRRGPLVAALPAGSDLWLDGGHNPAAGVALAMSLGRIAMNRPVHLIAGMLDTKDTAVFLRPLAACAASLTAITIPNEAHARPAEAVAAAGQACGIPSGTAAGVEEAVLDLASDPKPKLVLICGSLYLAGQVLRAHG